jgi:hypothetical protein
MTTNALAPTTTGLVTTSTSVKATTTPGQDSTTTKNMAYATNAASLLCGAAQRPPTDCQPRNVVGSSAKSVVDEEFNATRAGEVMEDLADLSSCGNGGSSDSFNDGLKKDLRRAATDLKNSKFGAVS